MQPQSRCVLPLFFYSAAKRGADTGISFVDATALKVCHNLRIPAHRVFRGSAGRAKSSTGWYFGFKLHLAINERGEILGFYLTAANVDERETVDWLTQDLHRRMVGDKGYISKDVFEKLMKRGWRLITKLRRNMKNRFVSMEDKILLRKRSAAGAVSSMRLGNGKWESTQFNSRLQPVQIALGNVQNANDLLKLNYTYNSPR